MMIAESGAGNDLSLIRHMLEARSVALVGASSRPGSVGATALAGLRQRGFTGHIYPVNPRHRELQGSRCWPSLGDLPESVDLAVIALPNAQLEEALEQASRAKARAAVIFASGSGEASAEESPLTERLRRIARDGAMSLCGPNCMGFVNATVGLQVCGYRLPALSDDGRVSLISHSGSSFSALLHNDRRLRFNVAVSSGLELVTTAADYLRYVVRLESTRAVGLVLEQIRDPEGFASAVAAAHDRDIPLAVLKLGRDPRAADMVASHSGAVAGDTAAYEAFFDFHGIHSVVDLDELADTLELFSAPRRATRGGLGAVTDSGGERSLLVDVAGSSRFSELGESTTAALQAILGPELAPANPVDAFSTDRGATRVFAEALRCLQDDDNTGAVMLSVDLTGESWKRYATVVAQVADTTTKPFVVLVPYPGGMNPNAAALIRADGVPVLEGVSSGLAALGHLFDHRDFRQRPAPAPRPATDAGRRRAWARRLSDGTDSLGEAAALELVSAWGIPVARTISASSEDDALRAAAEVGWPVALKTATREVAHKSDRLGVFVGLDTPERLRAAYRSCASRLGPVVNIQEMAPPGVELALGIVRDADFGPLVLIAAGGTLVELVGDRRVALPPVDDAGALRLIDGLRIRPLLNGFRGTPAVDIDAVASAVVSVSALAEDLASSIDALDINPVVVTETGCVAVDALVIPRQRGGTEERNR